MINTVLKQRFDENMQRHPSLTWDEVEARLTDEVIKIIARMEETGGEPDAILMHDGRLAYVDCCAETSDVRRSLCYDKVAWDKRKTNKPAGNAVDAANEIGAALINEVEYIHLQTLGDFDCKGQTWLATPEEFRKNGDGLFANKRHGRTFVYYNGAESYYRVRGFRTVVYL